MSRPSPRQRLAMMLAADNVVMDAPRTRAAVLAVWRAQTPEQRRLWARKAARLLVLAPEMGLTITGGPDAEAP